MDLKEIKRSSLSKFRELLNTENPHSKCFICDEKIINETPSIDHVIPWSFLFSDDVWNLVYTHKACNSQKSNVIPTEKEIEKLEKRNATLLHILMSDANYKTKKPTKELEIAIEKDYVKKFWINCKT